MKKRILVTGATGYVGGLLLQQLDTQLYQVRALARYPQNLLSRLGKREVDVVQADVLDPISLEKALQGIDIAFYLIHSMAATQAFEKLEEQGAYHFARAAKKAGVQKIIYLGGLVAAETRLSAHMRSRCRVGEILASTGVAVCELRSSVIIGAGSLSYEMMKALVNKLPVMIAPQWIEKLVQPIYIQDVLLYLCEAMQLTWSGHLIIEIGGATQVSYKNFMLAYAAEKKLKRKIFTVPVLTPWLSSLWLGLVTPVYARIGRKLIQSIQHDSIVRSHAAREYFSIKPLGYQEALHKVIAEEKKQMIRRWYSAISSRGFVKKTFHADPKKRKKKSYEHMIDASPEKVYRYLQTLGGKNGWYGEWLWKLRGVIDLLCGGVGCRRLRLDATSLQVGDPVDFWRVIVMKENEQIVFKAEMKVPGEAFLTFYLKPSGHKTLLRMESIFDPQGLFGKLYWYLLLPFHEYIFKGLIHRIVKEAPSHK